jgi:hypothetical protein
MKQLLLVGAIGFVFLFTGGLNDPLSIPDSGLTAYARIDDRSPCSTDHTLDLLIGDSDYLRGGEGIYYILGIYSDRQGIRPIPGHTSNLCWTRIIAELDVPWTGDFDLYLYEDTWPWECRLDRLDNYITSSRRSGYGVDERIDFTVRGGRCYFVLVYAYAGSGWYEIAIGLDD